MPIAIQFALTLSVLLTVVLDGVGLLGVRRGDFERLAHTVML